MAIPAFEEIKATVIAKEIEPFEKDIVSYLELPSTVSYLSNDEISVKTITRTFKDRSLTEDGVEALKASIEAGGWTDVTVSSTVSERLIRVVTVSFVLDVTEEEPTEPVDPDV